MPNTWNRIWIEQPVQDTYSVTIDGETYEPTYRWRMRIWAERSDGQTVFVNCDVEKDEFDPMHVWLALHNAFQTLDLIWKDKTSDAH